MALWRGEPSARTLHLEIFETLFPVSFQHFLPPQGNPVACSGRHANPRASSAVISTITLIRASSCSRPVCRKLAPYETEGLHGATGHPTTESEMQGTYRDCGMPCGVHGRSRFTPPMRLLTSDAPVGTLNAHWMH